MFKSPFNIISKNGINLPDEIETKIAEMSVLLKQKLKQTLDDLKVEITIGSGMFERVYPKTKAQQLLDSFYWNYGSEELAYGLSEFYEKISSYSNTMDKYFEIVTQNGNRYVSMKFEPHRVINLLDYQTLITLRHFLTEENS